MTTTPSPPQTFVRRALGGHAAIGLLAGALLYIISLTGTLVVIHDRLQRWEQPDIAEAAVLTPAAAQAAMANAIAQDRGKPPTTHLYIRMPTADLPRTVVTTDHGGWYVDGNGFVTEGASCNAWIVTKEGKVVTRTATSGILAGITRAVLIDVLASMQLTLEERSFTPQEAYDAAEAFVSSASQIVMPVISIDGKTIGDGTPGGIAKRLRDEFHHFAAIS